MRKKSKNDTKQSCYSVFYFFLIERISRGDQLWLSSGDILKVDVGEQDPRQPCNNIKILLKKILEGWCRYCSPMPVCEISLLVAILFWRDHYNIYPLEAAHERLSKNCRHFFKSNWVITWPSSIRASIRTNVANNN